MTDEEYQRIRDLEREVDRWKGTVERMRDTHDALWFSSMDDREDAERWRFLVKDWDMGAKTIARIDADRAKDSE